MPILRLQSVDSRSSASCRHTDRQISRAAPHDYARCFIWVVEPDGLMGSRIPPTYIAFK